MPDVPDGVAPIIPVVIGSSEDAVKLASALFDEGIFAPAIRPPTVPAGTARLRISLSVDHAESDIDRLCDALGHRVRK